MSQLYDNSIFWVDVEKIKPNPFQPRREFDESRLKDLSDSIRQYGVLQPLVVSRMEVLREDGGISVEYELIAGERRLRASKLANIEQVPVIIRIGDDNMAKLELAIIENLQREDLNAVERARAFHRFVEEFKFTHNQIGIKVGKSREYVSNTLRLLALPQEILDALSAGKISEGHTRPILMLTDRPQEQMVLFKEIIFKKMTVRDAERVARKIATSTYRTQGKRRIHYY
jgi:ParB family chromosome partitioning protein